MEAWKNEKANVAEDAAKDKYCLKNCRIDFDRVNFLKLESLTLEGGIGKVLNKTADVNWGELKKPIVFRFHLEFMYAHQKRSVDIRKRYSDFKRLDAALIKRYQTQEPHQPNETLGYHLLPVLCKEQAKVHIRNN